MVVAGKSGRMVAVRAGSLTSVPLKVAAGGPRVVPVNHNLVRTARSTGAYFGD
jgi:hypothetical protein